MREKSRGIEWDFSSVCAGAVLASRGFLYSKDGSSVSWGEGVPHGRKAPAVI